MNVRPLLLLPLTACTLILPDKIVIGTDPATSASDPTTESDSWTTSTSTSDDDWTQTDSSSSSSTDTTDTTDTTGTTETTETTPSAELVTLEGWWIGTVTCPVYGDLGGLGLDLDAQGEGYGALAFAAYDVDYNIIDYLIDFVAALSPSQASATAGDVSVTVTTSDCWLIDPYSAELYCETYDDVIWSVQDELISGTMVNFLQLGITCDFELTPYAY